jgi:hypothetical protein
LHSFKPANRSLAWLPWNPWFRNRALAFVESRVADGEGRAPASLGLLRVGVPDTFGCGLRETFGLGEALARSVVEGSCHTIDCGVGFGLGVALIGGTVGLGGGELEAFARLVLTVGLAPLVLVSGLDLLKRTSTLARCPSITSTLRVLSGALVAVRKILCGPGARKTSAGGWPKSARSIVSAASVRSLLTINVP